MTQPEPLAVIKGHQKRVWRLDVSPCGKWLISSCDDSIFYREWSLDDYQRTARFRPEHRTITRSPIRYSHDGRWIVAALNASTVGVWCAETYKLQTSRQFECPDGLTFYDMAISPDGQQLAVGGSFSNGASSVTYIWDFETGELIHNLPAHEYPVTGLEFHPHKPLLATAGMFDHAKLWQLPGEEMQLLEHTGRTVDRVAFSPDGEMLYTSGEGNLRAWDLQTGHGADWHRSLEPQHCHSLLSLAVSPAGDLLLAGGTAYILAIELPSGREIAMFPAHAKSYVTDIVFTPCGQRFISCNMDKTIQVWATASIF